MILFPGFFSTADDYVGLQKELNTDLQIFDYTGLTSVPLAQLGPCVAERINKPIRAIGYSMGGRVLLELAKYDPKKIERACFISTNPGLKLEIERKQRLMNDEVWSQKFLTADWSTLVHDWNAQAVFVGATQEPQRSEKNFDRRVLSDTIRNWSLGRQDDHRKLIEKLSVPNLWVAGAIDKKFCGFLKDVNIGKKTQTRVVTEAGHRVHLDQPKNLARVINSWMLESEGRRVGAATTGL